MNLQLELSLAEADALDTLIKRELSRGSLVLRSEYADNLGVIADRLVRLANDAEFEREQ